MDQHGGITVMNKAVNIFRELDNFKYRGNGIVDLTRSMDSTLAIYTGPGYSDPEFKINRWCTVGEKGFSVSQVMMGTQTGTHIDAPAHFMEGGATLDTLRPDELMGRYFLVDLESSSFDESIISSYTGESFLFVKSCRSRATITRDFFERLLSLNARVWVTAGEFGIEGEEDFSFNRSLALMGKFLVEDLEIAMAETITTDGYIFTMPLKLTGTSGAPCRVAVIQSGI
jgi:kynurenine formamidase